MEDRPEGKKDDVGLFTPYDKEKVDEAAEPKTSGASTTRADRSAAKTTQAGAKTANQAGVKTGNQTGAKTTNQGEAKTTGQGANTTNQTGTKTTKKSIPTPTRRQAEQARRDRIQPVLTRKQARNKEKEARYKSQDEQMAKVHALPYNAMIRDWVDHRWNVAEFVLPVMLVSIVTLMVGTYVVPTLMSASLYIMWGIFGVLVLDVVVMWLGCRTQLRNHFPREPLKGKMSYALSRSIQMRRSRVPPPRIKRGAKFQWPYREES